MVGFRIAILTIFICLFSSFSISARAEDRPFKRSELYYEIQARKWMKELTKKAEKSLAKKKEREDYQRLYELRHMSYKRKVSLKNRRIAEYWMGTSFFAK